MKSPLLTRTFSQSSPVYRFCPGRDNKDAAKNKELGFVYIEGGVKKWRPSPARESLHDKCHVF